MSSNFNEEMSTILQRAKRTEKAESRLKDAEQKHRDAIERMRESNKQTTEYYRRTNSSLKTQIEFMGSIIKGLFATCEICEGSGGYVIDMGEEGHDFDECGKCLGTGFHLAEKKESE